MADATTTPADSCEQTLSFSTLTEQVKSLISNRQMAELGELVSEFDAGDSPICEKLLLSGLLQHIGGQHAEAVATLCQARDAMAGQEFPLLGSIYTTAFIGSQLGLTRRERPATARGYSFYKGNLAAMREVDAELAQEIQASNWPSELLLIEIWDGLRLFNAGAGLVLTLNEASRKQIEPHIDSRSPIAFGGIITGQEIHYCLEHQVDVIHGMTRVHYLYEPSGARLRALMHLFDFSEQLCSQELIVFGGSMMEQRVRELFSTFRYPPPVVVLGDTETSKDFGAMVIEEVFSVVPKDSVENYYRSAEFRARQRRIAAGEIKPRVVVDTCRWTTFLQYCAADFEKAFAQLGCETRYLIEDNDVQSLISAFHWSVWHEFKPDMVFMVSHARPAMPFMPQELPVIGFIQDKCGPIQRLPDLAEHISREDMFVCMMRDFQEYLLAKSVPRDQMFVMPIPADETMFFPLAEDHPAARKFSMDVSFVKHGHPHVEKVKDTFFQQRFGVISDLRFKDHLEGIFADLYHESCHGDETRYYEPWMQEFAAARLFAQADENMRHEIFQMVSQFYITVYSAHWRCCFLEALVDAGIELGLYGNDWPEHARLQQFDRGPLGRQTELNAAYNFSRINLSVHLSGTMHQRLAECGLAGGFMMVADHPAENDWEPARPYFEADKEVVYFDSRADLVEKCRYYLTHESERREIAENMRKRALRERTCRAGAETVLKRWREVLTRAQGER